MPIRDLLRKKNALQADVGAQSLAASSSLAVPGFKFVRSTTDQEEEIEPPTYPEDYDQRETREQKARAHVKLGFRNSSNSEYTRDPTARVESEQQQSSEQPKKEHRLSRFNLHNRSRPPSSGSQTSINLPSDLPEAPESVGAVVSADGKGEDKELTEQREAKWEKRATILAKGNPLLDSESQAQARQGGREGSRSPSISNAEGDVTIQNAVRLHEEGDLEKSTQMFAVLADARGQNNALAQVLYGLALRHAWGIEADAQKAVHYLSLAASNSAAVEEQALASGLQRGGAAKGELVLAIFELANCFRHGWGVKKDAVAARQYYETAANLGDTDAMEEAARCYMEGFGGGKDKYKAAQYLRLAEKKGSSQVGNSWIWKEKYNPKHP